MQKDICMMNKACSDNVPRQKKQEQIIHGTGSLSSLSNASTKSAFELYGSIQKDFCLEVSIQKDDSMHRSKRKSPNTMPSSGFIEKKALKTSIDNDFKENWYQCNNSDVKHMVCSRSSHFHYSCSSLQTTEDDTECFVGSNTRRVSLDHDDKQQSEGEVDNSIFDIPIQHPSNDNNACDSQSLTEEVLGLTDIMFAIKEFESRHKNLFMLLGNNDDSDTDDHGDSNGKQPTAKDLQMKIASLREKLETIKHLLDARTRSADATIVSVFGGSREEEETVVTMPVGSRCCKLSDDKKKDHGKVRGSHTYSEIESALDSFEFIRHKNLFMLLDDNYEDSEDLNDHEHPRSFANNLQRRIHLLQKKLGEVKKLNARNRIATTDTIDCDIAGTLVNNDDDKLSNNNNLSKIKSYVI